MYHLAVGQPDPQGPHTRDEVYYVLSGRATIRVGQEQQPVGPGSIVHVAASVEHKFLDITEDMDVLVYFAGPPAV